MSRPTPQRSRNWCFTDHYAGDEPDIDPRKVRYLVAQQERCPRTGRIHWQGYVQFDVQQRASVMKKLNPFAHWEIARGKPDQNRAYCTKLETRVPGTDPVELGEYKSQGQRTELKEFHAAIVSGKRTRHMLEEHISVFARYPRLYGLIVRGLRPLRNPDRKVILRYGQPGVGKTKGVYDMHETDPEFWRKPVCNGTDWYDGYDGHKIALIDEFQGAASKVSLSSFLQIIDIYPVEVAVKGGQTWFYPETIYITSNRKPADWYDYSTRPLEYGSLIRRITEAHCWHMVTGEYTHCKNNAEVRAYFPLEQRASSAERYPYGPPMALRED